MIANHIIANARETVVFAQKWYKDLLCSGNIIKPR